MPIVSMGVRCPAVMGLSSNRPGVGGIEGIWKSNKSDGFNGGGKAAADIVVDGAVDCIDETPTAEEEDVGGKEFEFALLLLDCCCCWLLNVG